MEIKPLRKCKYCGLEAHSEKELEQFVVSNNRSPYGRALECKKCRGEHMKKYNQRPDVQERMKKWRKAYQQPENKEKIRAYRQRPDVKKKRNEYNKQRRKLPEVRQREREAMQRYKRRKHPPAQIRQVTCKNCGSTFESKYRNAKFCSAECRVEYTKIKTTDDLFQKRLDDLTTSECEHVCRPDHARCSLKQGHDGEHTHRIRETRDKSHSWSNGDIHDLILPPPDKTTCSIHNDLTMDDLDAIQIRIAVDRKRIKPVKEAKPKMKCSGRWTIDDRLREAPIYLTNIHNQSEQNKNDLHVFLYYCNFEACPICNEWLTMRSPPKLEA